jgi:hypothetical protein
MGNINQEEEVGNKQNQATRTAEVEYIKNGEGDLHAEVECRQLALLLNLSRPLPCIPCITGAGHSRGGPVGAPQRGGQEEEKSIDGMEAVEARRHWPASGGASPTQEDVCGGGGLSPASGGGGSSPATGEQGRGVRVRVRWSWRRRDRAKCGCALGARASWRGRQTLFCWAGPYPIDRYVSTNILKICKINKISDTAQIRIGRVLTAYPIRDTLPQSLIRAT